MGRLPKAAGRPRVMLDSWPAGDHNRSIVSHRELFAKPSRVLTALGLALAVCACAPRSAKVLHLETGLPVELDGWTITVNAIRWLTPDVYRTPSSEHGFLAVALTLENTTDGIRYVMPERQMLALGPDGSSLQADPSAGVLAARDQGWLVVQGEIGPGQTLTGAVAYEVPLDLRGWRWVFRPQLLGSRMEAVLELENLTIE